MKNKSISVVIAGGGTAGHIEPALAVGAALRQHYDARITALGTARGLECDIVPARGIDLRLIPPVPIPRKFSAELFTLPVKLVKAVIQTRQILTSVQADAVFGTGGYVAAPAYLAAKSLGVPFFVLETNALAGMANKLGVKLGGIGFNAQAGSGMPGEVVGVPVRPGLAAEGEEAAALADTARSNWNLDAQRPVILVTGGSQGAQSINQAIAGALSELTRDYQVLHAYGKKNQPPAESPHYTAVPYIDDMAGALAVADLVVCRSGAMTVAEVSAAALPAIYIPLPHGNGEQALNSQHLVAAGAAVQIADAELTPPCLVAAVREILADKAHYDGMVRALAETSAGNVAALLADRIVERIKK